jgi:hypothetical protein
MCFHIVVGVICACKKKVSIEIFSKESREGVAAYRVVQL